MHHCCALASGQCRVAGGSAVRKRNPYMSTLTKGASAPSESPPREYQEIVVKRDGNRPISFSGQALAKVSMSGGITAWSVIPTLYKARVAQFVQAPSKPPTYIPLTPLTQHHV